MLLEFSIIFTLFRSFLRVTGDCQVRGGPEVIVSSTCIRSSRTYLFVTKKRSFTTFQSQKSLPVRAGESEKYHSGFFYHSVAGTTRIYFPYNFQDIF